MAAVTHRVSTADTGGTPNTSGGFTPTLNDLLVVLVVAAATSQVTATLTSSTGLTFTQIARADFDSDSDSIYVFASNNLVSDTTAGQTVTFDVAADPSTGTVINVFSVSGMSKTGSLSLLQAAIQENQAAATTPAPVFGSSVLTSNPTIGIVGNNSNPAALTTPTDWTEANDTGFNTPTTGSEVVFRNSGFTGTTVTWGSTSATAFGAIVVELDASSSDPPFFTQLDAAYV